MCTTSHAQLFLISSLNALHRGEALPLPLARDGSFRLQDVAELLRCQTGAAANELAAYPLRDDCHVVGFKGHRGFLSVGLVLLPPPPQAAAK